MHHVAGMPKSKNGMNVAARSKLDAAPDIFMAFFNTGMRYELIPKAKPKEKKNSPMMARGNT